MREWLHAARGDNELHTGYSTVVSDVPISLRLTDDTLTGQATGSGHVTIRLTEEFAGKELMVNGQPAGTIAQDGSIHIVLTAEINTIETSSEDRD